jgi:methylenetetrahydrofolate reductase (NADPH)
MPVRISDLYQSGAFGLSIEIFPPKSPDGDAALFDTLERLARYRPGFVSCTYGAGGSTRERTIDLCVEISKRFNLSTTAHLTCVGSTRAELLDWLKTASTRGITNIMALRGDPPAGQTSFKAVDGGLRYANELVSLIREHFPKTGVGVAGYPEKHQECPDPETDLDNLKRKVDAGADAVFTQLFFINRHFFEFQERYRQAGICVPLVPGIMPITSYARIKRITAMCDAIFPEDLAAKLEAVQDDDAAQFEIGVEHAVTQCRALIDSGVPGMHFYALNKSQACERILDALGFELSAAECA